MSKHMKRLATPRTWRLQRKKIRWAVKPSAGPHPQEEAIPLAIIVRDYLGLANTNKEAKHIIGQGEIHVDGTIQKNHQYPCGLMDVIAIPKMKKQYRIILDQHGKIVLEPISADDASWKLCRIEDKTTLKENKTQLNLHDGKNLLVDKDTYKTGDVLKISFDKNKIEDTYSFEQGNVSYVIGGAHVGHIANIKEIETTKSSKPNLVHLKGDKEFTTVKDYVFMVGKKKPVISFSEVKP